MPISPGKFPQFSRGEPFLPRMSSSYCDLFRRVSATEGHDRPAPNKRWESYAVAEWKRLTRLLVPKTERVDGFFGRRRNRTRKLFENVFRHKQLKRFL